MTETDRAMLAIAAYDAEIIVVEDRSMTRSDARHEIRVLRAEIERSAIAIATATEIATGRLRYLAKLEMALGK
jgi:hypothetical protein